MLRIKHTLESDHILSILCRSSFTSTNVSLQQSIFFLTLVLLIEAQYSKPIQSKAADQSALNQGITSYEGGGHAFKSLAVLVSYMSPRSNERYSRYLRKQNTALSLFSSPTEEETLSSHPSSKEGEYNY